MKIVHTSDWHLGAKLHERDRSEDQRMFLAFLREVMAAERPDALLIAGDVFDTRQPTPSAQRLYYDFIADAARDSLCKSIVITAGNHDSAQLLAAADQVLQRLGVHVVANATPNAAGEILSLKDSQGKCALAIAAVPFMNDATLANFRRKTDDGAAAVAPSANVQERIAAGFRAHYEDAIAEARRIAEGAPVVVMGHCTIAGSRLSDQRSERGRQIGGLDERDASVFAGADYAALGHLHIPQTTGAGGRVRYSGSPLAMSFSEAGAQKSVTVVEFGERAGDAIDIREIPVPEFTPLRVLDGSQDDIRAALANLAANASSPILVAIKVTAGEGEMAAFVNEARALAGGSAVEILPIEDARARSAEASQATRDTATLDELSPHDVALLRLADEHLSDDELATYSAMIAEAIAECD